METVETPQDPPLEGGGGQELSSTPMWSSLGFIVS